MNTDTIANSNADDPTKALCSLSQNWWLFVLRGVLANCQRPGWPMTSDTRTYLSGFDKTPRSASGQVSGVDRFDLQCRAIDRQHLDHAALR